tara:strand:+ start:593 stop:868 length:276 start_codon:yes stop_codon:yes gene_type:complete
MKHTKVYTTAISILKKRNKELKERIKENEACIRMNQNLDEISKEHAKKRNSGNIEDCFREEEMNEQANDEDPFSEAYQNYLNYLDSDEFQG